jgi:signal transduction histidine kinase
MEAGKYRLFREFVPVVSTVNSMVNSLKIVGRTKNIKFKVVNSLNDRDSRLYFYFDMPKIEQAFRNLSVNCVNFSSANDEIIVTIFREETSDNFSDSDVDTSRFGYSGSLCVSFSDSGIGISKENIGSVFDEFDPHKLQGGGGAGLGLHITRNIIIAHEGTVKAVSDGIGTGTTFIMTFGAFKRLDEVHTQRLTHRSTSHRNAKEDSSVRRIEEGLSQNFFL